MEDLGKGITIVENQSNKKAAQAFASAFSGAFADSLTQLTGSAWQLKVLDSPDLGTRQGQPVHYRITVDGALHGECFIESYEPQIMTLGSKVLNIVEPSFSEDQADAVQKAIAQAMPELTAALAEEYGELTFTVDRVTGLAFGGMFVVPLSASGDGESGLPILLFFDGELLSALSSGSLDHVSDETERARYDAVNLELVMDVELNVTLRFGQRQLPLREVLELSSGSVIELDRLVDEPVELLLDGKMIARGEAVIVDGNYGLRVTEIPQPMATHFIR